MKKIVKTNSFRFFFVPLHAVMKWLETISRRYTDWDERMKVVKVHVDDDDTEHVCMHCGTLYEGRFCPHCGLNYTRSHFTMKTLVLNFLDIWGMGSRPMWRTIKELMTRPGYMIRDYLNGHHLNYFPPFKMLVIIALIYVVIARLLGVWPSGEVSIDTSQIDTTDLDQGVEAATKSLLLMAKAAKEWWNHNLVYTIIFQVVFMVIAMRWGMGRRLRLSVPETFFALMYVSCQMQLLAILYLLIFWKIPNTLCPFFVPDLLAFIILVYDHRQLYGITFRQSFCRTLLSLFYLMLLYAALFLLVVIMAIVWVVVKNPGVLH